MCITEDMPLTFDFFSQDTSRCVAFVENSTLINGTFKAVTTSAYKRLYLNVLGHQALIKQLRSVYFASFMASTNTNVISYSLF